MAGFSSTDAALEGFRLTREQPRVWLVWAGFAFVFSLISTVTMVGLAGPAFMQLRSIQGGATPDPQASLAAIQGLLPAEGVILLLSLIYYSVFYAAGNRAVLRPEQRSLGYLKLGADELMQLVVMVLLGLIAFAAYLVLIIGVVVLAVIGALASKPLGVILAIVGGMAGFCAFIWLLVRLSLTSAATFDTGQIGIGTSWRLTKGRFWPLFGAYVLAFVLLIVIALLAMIIVVAVAAVIGGGITALGALFQPNFSSLAAYFTPVIIVQLILSAFVTALSMAVVICAPAYAYKQLRGEAAVGVAGGGTSV